MNYSFHFDVVWRDFDALMQGAWMTFQLGVLAFWGGALIGLLGAALKTYGPRPLRLVADCYVVFFTNTPALIQIYFLYFGLPEAGIRWSSEACVLIGLTLNAGAYLTMILRAGFLSVRRTELEAAETLGLSVLQQIRHVIVPHIARAIYPALANFFIVILVMGTSIGAVIGVDELTGQAINLATVNYRWLEYFTVVAGIYVVLTFVASIGLALLGRWAFRVRARIF
ncbi:MAG: ABC transporter permease [Paracoccaceae bacterium]|nr:MAG: amino acid ABC transporter permease [Alphaproteobacteria bacterium]GIX13849.1 MAG: ABC transporter permease [Paracoccaceae bacterium]